MSAGAPLCDADAGMAADVSGRSLPLVEGTDLAVSGAVASGPSAPGAGAFSDNADARADDAGATGLARPALASAAVATRLADLRAAAVVDLAFFISSSTQGCTVRPNLPGENRDAKPASLSVQAAAASCQRSSRSLGQGATVGRSNKVDSIFSSFFRILSPSGNRAPPPRAGGPCWLSVEDYCARMVAEEAAPAPPMAGANKVLMRPMNLRTPVLPTAE